MKSFRYVVASLGTLLALVLLPAPPASATIHEIVAQWCAGHGELQPPGIQDGKNFAMPVVKNGFVGPTVPFNGPAGPGQLITFNYGVAPAKVIGTGVFIVVGQTPGGPLYVELIEPDPAFAAFRHCPMFSAG
jgi:hypothetical protein